MLWAPIAGVQSRVFGILVFTAMRNNHVSRLGVVLVVSKNAETRTPLPALTSSAKRR